jgi:hypothetical protein
MKPALILALQGNWLQYQNGTWRTITPFSKSEDSCSILSDFDQAPFGVELVDVRTEFAAAVIEKKIRNEGLVDAEVHMVSHRVVSIGGGSKVFYTAVPLSTWQKSFSWAEQQNHVNLFYSVDGAMLHLCQKYDAVICRIGRQFRFLVSNSNNLISLNVTAYSDDPDDLDTALQTLIEQVRSLWQPRNEKNVLFWCDLLVQGSVTDTAISSGFAKKIGVSLSIAESQSFSISSDRFHSAAESMMSVLTWQNALNSNLDRFAAMTDRFVLPIASITGLIGVGLFAGAAYFGMQASNLRLEEQKVQSETMRVTSQFLSQAVAPNEALQAYSEQLNFLDKLNAAVNTPDPIRVLSDLRKAADKRVRILRIRLISKEAGFKIEGVPYVADQSERMLSGFLGDLKQSGYLVSAEDPGNMNQQAGFFAYSIRPVEHGAKQ